MSIIFRSRRNFTIYDNKGTLIDEFNTPEKRISVSIDKVPKIFKKCFYKY